MRRIVRLRAGSARGRRSPSCTSRRRPGRARRRRRRRRARRSAPLRMLRPVARRVHPRPHDLQRAAERAGAPGEVLADGVAARAAEVAACSCTRVSSVRAAGRDVAEEVAADHVSRVSSRGAGEVAVASAGAARSRWVRSRLTRHSVVRSSCSTLAGEGAAAALGHAATACFAVTACAGAATSSGRAAIRGSAKRRGTSRASGAGARARSARPGAGRVFGHTQRDRGAWRSLVAHLLWEQGVTGSNPVAPIIRRA